jgi:hypothetical protein
MSVSIHIYCPATGIGSSRSDLEEKLTVFFGNSAEDAGAGSGEDGFNLDYELAPGDDGEFWTSRVRDFLRKVGVRPGTVLEVFPDDWKPGAEFGHFTLW